ncbi:MAG: sulfatase-like hydrolase/transferase [Acidimicrobiales bacterium]
MAPRSGAPNILLVVSDQERQRSWLPAGVHLPWREKLMAEGLEFTNYWTHSSPCSPSRASLMTGRYLTNHGVVENVIHPHHTTLDPAIPTLGHILGAAGYRCSYIGKWHLSYGATPDMVAYGYSDWEGNDRYFMGWAGTGVAFDPVIASNAAGWIAANAAGQAQPWFLTVALVNPHDVMWFPIDQPFYQERRPDEVAFVRQILEAAKWKKDETLPVYDHDYPEVCDRLPANFGDALADKPEAHRQWRWDQQHGMWGYIDPSDARSWLRQLDYYAHLHRLADESLGTVLSALDRSGAADDTVVIFTSDHGDMCGSHGLRSKGPFVYNEIMKVPLYIKAPGRTISGSTTDSLGSHVDLARTIASLGGVSEHWSLQGTDLSPLLADPACQVCDYVLFAQDSAHTRNIQRTRYSLRGYFDGRFKYARYFGVGGGDPSDVLTHRPGHKLFGPDARFDDQDHELYDLSEDPHEMSNLAHDRGRRSEVQERFNDLLALESADLSGL